MIARYCLRNMCDTCLLDRSVPETGRVGMILSRVVSSGRLSCAASWSGRWARPTRSAAGLGPEYHSRRRECHSLCQRSITKGLRSGLLTEGSVVLVRGLSGSARSLPPSILPPSSSFLLPGAAIRARGRQGHRRQANGRPTGSVRFEVRGVRTLRAITDIRTCSHCEPQICARLC